MRSAKYPERFSPDGLTEQIIDALLPLVWPRHPLPHPPAAERTRPSARHRSRKRAAELWTEQDWLFTNEVGNPLNHRTDLAHWKQLLKAAGVRDARLHDARHTAATVLLELGVPDRAAMQIMGWSNAALTQRYQHVTGHVLGSVAAQVGAHPWEAPHAN